MTELEDGNSGTVSVCCVGGVTFVESELVAFKGHSYPDEFRESCTLNLVISGGVIPATFSTLEEYKEAVEFLSHLIAINSEVRNKIAAYNYEAAKLFFRNFKEEEGEQENG